MWQRVLLMDCIDILQRLRNSFQSTKLNTNINLLFWTSIFIGAIFYLFQKFLTKVFTRSKIIKINQSPTISLLWNLCFFTTSVFFLSFYHNYFIQVVLFSLLTIDIKKRTLFYRIHWKTKWGSGSRNEKVCSFTQPAMQRSSKCLPYTIISFAL